MTRWPLSYPLAAGVAALALLPLCVLFYLGAGAEEVFTSHSLKIWLNTLLLTLFTVIGAIALGVPLALLTAYVALPFRRLFLGIGREDPDKPSPPGS